MVIISNCSVFFDIRNDEVVCKFFFVRLRYISYRDISGVNCKNIIVFFIFML